MNWYKMSKKNNIISFDFDATLTIPEWDKEEEMWIEGNKPNFDRIKQVKRLTDMGYEIHIVTSRDPQIAEHVKEVYEFVYKYLKGYIKGVHFTGGTKDGSKLYTLQQLKPERHYDDSQEDINNAEEAGVKGIKILHPSDEGKNLPPKDNPVWKLIHHN